jgi:hypothetical protein
MKAIIVFFVAMVMIASFTAQSRAALTVLGTDSSGNRLIYDSALNITWYDFTKRYDDPSGGAWQNQKAWAEGLTVKLLNGQEITGWRLPKITNTNVGHNIATAGNEMNYLYYTELGNTTSLNNKGPFQNLGALAYWTGTGDTSDTTKAYYFNFSGGFQGYNLKTASYNALAVYDGNAVPIPSAVILLGSGLLGLAGLRKRLKKE